MNKNYKLTQKRVWKIGLFFIFPFLLPHLGLSQIKKDSLFLQYLLSNNHPKEAVTFLNQLQNKYPESSQHRFDLPFWKGFSHYNLKNLDSSIASFSKVLPSSIFYKKSLFLKGVSLGYLKKNDLAKNTFLTISNNDNDSISTATKTFELAGIALLQRNLPTFDSLSHHFSEQYYPLQKQQSNFKDYKDILLKQQRKSPLKAALLSAILPGAGKIYVGGQLGQGISTFLQNAILGVQAYEGLSKDGVASPRFIVYGALFSLFYIGNIWGSSISAKIKRQEFNDKIDDQILFDMHIPLRTIFN